MGTVGRRGELTALEAAVTAGRNVAVLGALGMGKSHLVRQALHRMRVHALVGTGLRLASDRPYLPLAMALGEPPPASAGREAVAGWCAERLDGRLLVIEQLQWVDCATLAVLMDLAPLTPLVVSARDDEPMPPEVKRLLGSCEVIRLRPLEELAGRLVMRAHSDGRTPLHDDDVASAGGCPLVLRELAGGHSPLLRALEPMIGRRQLVAEDSVEQPHARPLPRPFTSQPVALSPREREALEAVRSGSSTRAVAESWGVAPSTVDAHVRSAMRKLGARTRWQAALVANDTMALAGSSHG